MKEITIKLEAASTRPIYLQIKDQIGAYIRDSRLKPGTLLPTLSSIARQAGVSMKTAERAVDLLIEDGICFRRPKKGTYVAGTGDQSDGAASPEGIKHGKNCLAFLLIGRDFLDAYQARVLKGIEESAYESSHHLLYSAIAVDDHKMLMKRVRDFSRRSDLIAILLGGNVRSESVRKVRNAVAPAVRIVVLGRTDAGIVRGVDTVLDSNEQAVRVAFQHLVQLGHKRIGFINGPHEWAWNRAMSQEFYQLLKKHHLLVIRDAIQDNLDGDDLGDGIRAARKVLSVLGGDSVTALLCTTDRLAWGVLAALAENNVTVPGDVSVVGLGNLAQSRDSIPPLTTVDQCPEEKGREGAIAAMGRYPPGIVIKGPVQLVVRGSTRKLEEQVVR